ncbi:sugar dehydrogenase [Cobetia sp. 4B]|uniref:PQQ-dependent sugar dehydrogenase n=1 Tax=Cobetia sp. 4B TaxID=2758724 RepID=UPI001C040B1D|nr:sugar dehydrogenase [Cobetia sp. 4B]QWN36252.1 sugar dehydrogenase [Cobetia sp. 4B]
MPIETHAAHLTSAPPRRPSLSRAVSTRLPASLVTGLATRLATSVATRLVTGAAAACLALSLPAQAETDAASSLSLVSAQQVPSDAPALKLPEGAALERLASLDSPRMLHLTDAGELLIGSRAERVYRAQLTPDGNLSAVKTLVELSGYPHSLVVRGDKLYVATTAALLVADYSPGESLTRDDFRELIALPGGGGHNSRTLSLGPDGGLYLALGIQGNCSNQYLAGSEQGYSFSERRGGVLRLEESGDAPHWQPWASGLRNPVGLAWQLGMEDEPRLLATNNGPDHWGYEQPRELVVAAREGSFHGMPWYQWVDGRWQADDCITSDSPRERDEIAAPLAEIPARSAPMGIAVVPPEHPLSSDIDVVVAVHGSWGTAPSGNAAGAPASRREPRLLGLKLATPDTEARLVPVLTGLQDSSSGQRWIRPLDVLFGPDGSLYFTSDSGAAGLYRLTFD